MMNPTNKRITASKTIPSACWLAVISFLARSGLIVKTLRTRPEKARGTGTAHASPPSAVSYFLHPEQEAQQSSDAQQPACAAVAAPARPSAIIAINTTTLSFFMIFLLCI
jgi:hypothetical protein